MLQPTEIDAASMDAIRHLIPAPEPSLSLPAGRKKLLHVSEPVLDGNELQYLTDCIQSNWISSAGPYVEKFERAFAETAGCKFAIACSSGTSACHLMLAALGIGPGDEVIIPTFTMIATANAVSYTGAIPVLVDAEPETWNMDTALVESKITSRTKTIFVVHTYGHPAAMGSLLAIARKYNIPVIEDAAEAHGASYHGRPVGSLGVAGAFSFYGNKILTTGEGGMVTTNDAELAGIIRKIRGHAFSNDFHFWHKYRGFNYRMTNLQAALGLAQTERLAEFVAKRRHNAALYAERLGDISGLTLPVENEAVRNVFWMYCILVEDDFPITRDELRLRLARCGIETRTMFVPIHLQPVYFEKQSAGKYPVAESLCCKGMYLPSGASLNERDIDYITCEIRRATNDS